MARKQQYADWWKSRRASGRYSFIATSAKSESVLFILLSGYLTRSLWHYTHLPCHTACKILKESFYGMYNHVRSNKRNTVVVGVSHNYLFSVSSSEQN